MILSNMLTANNVQKQHINGDSAKKHYMELLPYVDVEMSYFLGSLTQLLWRK